MVDKEIQNPSPINSFDGFIRRLSAAPNFSGEPQLIQRSPETEYAVFLPEAEAQLIISRHISPSFPGEKQINLFLALSCQNQGKPSAWKLKVEPFSNLPRTQFGLELEWLKTKGGYQKIIDGIISTNLLPLSQELRARRQLAIDTASLLTAPIPDDSPLQIINHVYDQGKLYLLAPKPKRRRSRPGLEIFFSAGGVVEIRQGFYNPENGSWRPKPRARVFSQRLGINDSPEEVAQWILEQIRNDSEMPENLKRLIPPASPKQE